jgi:transitional endoplasmic reticulum ATPase
MTLPIGVNIPSRGARARIWRRIAADAGLRLDDAAVRRLSAREAPPAVAANAVRVATLVGGGEAEISKTVGGLLEILGIRPSMLDSDGQNFDPKLVNCDENLARLVELLAAPAAPRNWSLCIHGAPGTGKSLFARHLAGRLGLEVMKQRASDLLSKWVGESEKRIAAAFATARAQGAVLLIDEADSLLADRWKAVRSWEVTQVNEMLTWMEDHPLPFICTTNLMDRLDQRACGGLRSSFGLMRSNRSRRHLRSSDSSRLPHRDGCRRGSRPAISRLFSASVSCWAT